MLDYIMEFLANGCYQTNPDESGFAVHALNSNNCPMGTKGVKVFIPETEIEAYKSRREKEKNRAYLISFIGNNDAGIVYLTKTVYIPGDGELTLDEYIKYIAPMEEKEVSHPVTLNIIKFGGFI